MGTRDLFGYVLGAICASAVSVLAACGGESKPAQSPAPAPAASDQPSETAAKEQAEEERMAPPKPSDDAEKTSGKPPYDKEATEGVIARAARQIKANCGAATDEDGKATGPWGKPKIGITLGRNGHTQAVVLPKDYEGQPTGKCIAKAFSNLTFPPYAYSADVTVDWEVEVIEPAAKPAAGKPGKGK